MLSSLFSYLNPTDKIRRKDIENPESFVPRIKCQFLHVLIVFSVIYLLLFARSCCDHDVPSCVYCIQMCMWYHNGLRTASASLMTIR